MAKEVLPRSSFRSRLANTIKLSKMESHKLREAAGRNDDEPAGAFPRARLRNFSSESMPMATAWHVEKENQLPPAEIPCTPRNLSAHPPRILLPG